MRVVIQDNYDKMCKWAADYIAAKIKAHKEAKPLHLHNSPPKDSKRLSKAQMCLKRLHLEHLHNSPSHLLLTRTETRLTETQTIYHSKVWHSTT